jgi:nicotinamidase-related amidase
MGDVEDRAEARLKRIDELHRIERGRSALLVVDMQHGFLDEGASLEVPKGREILQNVARCVEACRAVGMPVIFTEFVYATSIPCLRGDPFGMEHLPRDGSQPLGYGYPSSNCLIGPNPGTGTESSATVEALAPRDVELVIEAHTYDKFYGTHLDLALRSLGVDRLMITGVTTDVCVNSTLISASMRNYRVTAVTDGMATIHDHIHEACLQIWQNKFARIASTAQLLDEIAQA